MKISLKIVLTSILALTGFMFFNGVASVNSNVQAQVNGQSIADSVCQGVLGTQDPTVGSGVKAADCKESGTSTFTGVIKRIINIFSIVVGSISVIMVIIGGFRYIISGGDSNGVSGAKNTILYALVGLVIVLFAQIIVKFVVANLSTAAKSSSSTSSQTSKQN